MPPTVGVLIVAPMVIVVEPPAAMLPFHVTVFVAVAATAVPPVAEALTSVRLAGRTSVNSSPALSAGLDEPLFERTMV